MNVVNRLLAAPLPTALVDENGYSAEGKGMIAASLTSGAESYQAKTKACYILRGCFLLLRRPVLC